MGIVHLRLAFYKKNHARVHDCVLPKYDSRERENEEELE